MLTLPSIFSNHMVLQRNKEVHIWGCTDHEKISIALTKNSTIVFQKEVSVLGNDFYAVLPSTPAGGPYELTIEGKQEKIVYTDILFGDVWLAGGQSNMELELQNADDYDSIKDYLDERVRFYYTPKVAYVGDELLRAEKNTEWQTSTSEWKKAWSAVGYFYGAKLAEELNIPIGIIGCNWGGTSASCWVSQEALETNSSLTDYLKEYDDAVKDQDFEQYLKDLDDYKQYQEEFDKNVGNYYKTAPNPTWAEAISLFGECKYPGPIGPRSFTRPCGLYESMLKRVMPYTLSGFLFYQGEEDDNRPFTYEELLTTLITQWRKDWNDDTLPFFIVQLPIYHHDGEENDFQNWPFIREAQDHVSHIMNNAGLAVILDKGENLNIHPTDKKTVGDRLALSALYHHYHLRDEASCIAPYYISVQLQNPYVDITIQNGKGLHTIDKNGIWNEFEIAGEDFIYHPAQVISVTEKDHNTIIRLFSEQVSSPLMARYFWKNYGKVNIFGENGLPLAPFRTNPDDHSVPLGSRQGIIRDGK